MKNPSRMRTGLSANPPSSALDNHSTTSDVTEPSNKSGSSDTKFVSTRYNRRASTSMVKFQFHEKHTSATFNKQRKFKSLIPHTGLDNTDKTCENEETNSVDAVSSRRRMSAPEILELPPILNGVPRLGIINNNNLTSTSNTFHNYNFKNKSDPKSLNIIHNDSSISRHAQNNISDEGSSAHPVKSRLSSSAGTEPRNFRKPQFSLAEPSTDLNIDTEEKTSFTIMKNGLMTASTPRGGVTRATEKSRYVNPAVGKMKHCYSESKIAKGKTHVEKTLPRNKSERSLANFHANNGTHKSAVKHKDESGNKQITTPSESDNATGCGDVENHNVRATFHDSDSESDKDQRVLEWINNTANAEPPEDPQISYVDEPLQRDTAIRIVYDGDS